MGDIRILSDYLNAMELEYDEERCCLMFNLYNQSINYKTLVKTSILILSESCLHVQFYW